MEPRISEPGSCWPAAYVPYERPARLGRIDGQNCYGLSGRAKLMMYPSSFCTLHGIFSDFRRCSTSRRRSTRRYRNRPPIVIANPPIQCRREQHIANCNTRPPRCLRIIAIPVHITIGNFCRKGLSSQSDQGLFASSDQSLVPPRCSTLDQTLHQKVGTFAN